LLLGYAWPLTESAFAELVAPHALLTTHLQLALLIALISSERLSLRPVASLAHHRVPCTTQPFTSALTPLIHIFGVLRRKWTAPARSSIGAITWDWSSSHYLLSAFGAR
jgi:hypothetical protein